MVLPHMAEKQEIVLKWASEKSFSTFEATPSISFQFYVDLDWSRGAKTWNSGWILNNSRAYARDIFLSF